MSILCSMVGASFTVAAVAQVLRSKKGITAIGNAQVDTAQSKFGGASLLLDGTGDYLDATSFSQSAGDTFTFECWVRFAATPSSGTLAMLISSSSSANRYLALNNVSGTLNWEIGHEGTAGTFYRRWTATVSTNTWYHVALTKNGTTGRLFVNGTLLTPAQDFGTLDATEGIFSETMRLGAWYNTGNALNGHMDEIRISDIERYTTTFTPSTTAFVNDANTVFLMHANGTDASTFFEDDNGVRASRSLIAQGNAQIDTAQSKFGGASYLGDGTGDRLNVIGEVLDSQYTVEYWFRAASFSNGPTLVDFRGGAGGAANYSDYITSGGVFTVFVNNGNRIQSSALSTNTWYHIAVVRESNSDIKLYVNGTKTGDTYNYSGYHSNTTWYIGDNYVFSNSFNGHIDELRVSNSARYTANFTPSTTPFVNDANTLLLIHCDGGDILTAHTVFRDDNGVGRAAKSVVYRGNEQIDNAQSKFGGTSVYLDGQFDSPRVYMNGSWPSNLTIEGWFRPTDVTERLLWSTRTANNTLAAGEMQAYITDASKLQINLGSSVMTSTTTFATNTWYHVAVTKDGSSWKLWVNGTNEVSFTSAASVSGFDLIIGNSIEAFEFISYQGWIDEFRVSDTARYSATFTPATTAFQNDSNTVLLLHFDGTDGSNVFTDDNGVTPTHSYT